MTAMLSVKEGVHMNITIDLEEHHEEEEEVDINALIRENESIEAGLGRRDSGKAPGDPSVPVACLVSKSLNISMLD